MAIGSVSSSGDQITVELLASATTTSSDPTLATDGLAIANIRAAFSGVMPDVMTLSVTSTTGSGTITFQGRVWGYISNGLAAAVWVPIGAGGDTTKGLLNGGVTIGESGTDMIRHAEQVYLLGHFSRIYLQVTTLGGTSPAVIGLLHGLVNYPRAS